MSEGSSEGPQGEPPGEAARGADLDTGVGSPDAVDAVEEAEAIEEAEAVDTHGHKDADEDAGARSYLVCPPARPIRLKADHPVTVGRGEGNSVVIAEHFVSRNHAVIEWREGRFLVRDLGSRNGVHVNGTRVAEAALEPDDDIKIGSRTFTFAVGDEASVGRLFAHRRAEQRKGRTRALRVAGLVEAARGLKGNLADFGLADLLQALHNGGKTGRIAVAADALAGEDAPPEEKRGEILLRDGDVVSASFGDLAGEDAVYRMFEVEKGSFEFEAFPVEAALSVRTSFAALLMEAHRRLDEKHRPAPDEAAETPEAEGTTDLEERDPSAETHLSE